jgi:hypothetical protein
MGDASLPMRDAMVSSTAPTTVMRITVAAQTVRTTLATKPSSVRWVPVASIKAMFAIHSALSIALEIRLRMKLFAGNDHFQNFLFLF